MLPYRLVRLITFPFYWLVLKLRYRDQSTVFYEKMGRPTENRPKGELVWVHCDNFFESGEVVRGLAQSMPGKAILLTYNTNSASGHAGNIPYTNPARQSQHKGLKGRNTGIGSLTEK